MDILDYLIEENENIKKTYFGVDEEKKYKELQKKFRKVFSTEDGKIVLTAILEDLHFFQRTKDAEGEALCNYAKTLIYDRLNIGFNNLLVTEKLLTINILEEE